MSKVLECGSVVPGCRVIIHGDSEEDLMMKAMEHARTVHGVEHMSEQLKAHIRAAIKEGGSPAKSSQGAEPSRH
jgi:predicted small metal-binding protein